MNKKGFLLGEETIKLIIAVIGIGLLVYLLLALYFQVNNSERLEEAKSSLNFLMSEIESGKTKIDIYNPAKWYIGSWPHILVKGYYGEGATNVESETLLPVSCSNLEWKSCICICKENNVESCDSNGICLNNSQNFIVVGDIALQGNVLPEGVLKISNPPITLNIDYTTKKISK